MGADPLSSTGPSRPSRSRASDSLSRRLEASDEERGIFAVNANLNKGVEMPALHGSCVCGGVKFEIAGPLTPPSNCHCWMCRKQQGLHFAVEHGCAPPTSNGFRARIWSNSTSRRPALSGDFVASAVLRSSISLTPAPRRRYFALLLFRNTGLRLRHLMTTPGCAQRPTHLLAARHRGSKSPTICPDTQNFPRPTR